MTFADAGFFVALAQPRDALHARGRAWLTVLPGRVILTEQVLWETVNALSRPADRARAHVLVDHVRSDRRYEVVPATTELFVASLRLHQARPDKEWSLTDCLSFVVMKERGVTRALAHDHHFEQAGFEALLRRDPP